MTDLTEQGLLPAEHRALREAYATARQVHGHWTHLGRRLGGPPGDFLAEGAEAAADLLSQFSESPIPGVPTAQGMGASVGGVRGVSDLLLERNQAFRAALLELARLTILAGYLGGLARARGDAELAGRHARAEERLRELEERGRAIAVALADDPDAAIAPADGGRLGQAGLRLGVAMGSLGEAIDGSPIGRFARRHQ
jgi:hypothetical protein